MDNFGNTKCVFLALEVLPDQEKDKFWEVADPFPASMVASLRC